MKLKIESKTFVDPDLAWQRLSREFKAHPSVKTKFAEELWIVSLFLCFYNREFQRSFLICNKHLDELNKSGIDVLAKGEDGNLLGLQAKYFPTSNVIENRKKYRGPATIHVNKDQSERYLRHNTIEIEKMAISYLKEKLINDYDFVVIYLDSQFDETTWLKRVIQATGLKKEKIRTNEVWAFKNEKIRVSIQDLDKIAHRHRYKFFRLFPKFENYNYEFREPQ